MNNINTGTGFAPQQQVAPNNSNAPIYQPTPLEQAYSLYLGQNVFVIAPNMPMHISGRAAVPFLTRSGVNRQTLRSIWTAADPQNVGTLMEWSQFQLMLRLVSLAQAGILHAQGTPEEMRVVVQETSGQLLALPIFQSVIMPPHPTLLSTYQPFLVFPQTNSTADPSGDVTAFGTAFGVAATTTVSIDDAFSDIVPAVDAPLPSLESVAIVPPTPEETAPTSTDAAGSTNGGVMESNSSLPPPSLGGSDVLPPPPTMEEGSSTMMVSPIPLVETPNKEEEEDDDFGDFSNAPSQPSAASATPHLNTSDLGNAGIVDAFGGSSNAPLSSLPDPVPVAPLGNDNEDDDDFGGFAAAEPQPAPTNNSNFGGFVDASSPPVPVDDFGGFTMAAPQPVQSNNITNFGSFNDAAITPSVTDDEFGGFASSASSGTPTQSVPTINATNDDFGTFANATPTEGASQPVDDFGTFEAAAPQPNTNEFGTFADATAAIAQSSTDEFGNFTVATPAASQPISDDFGAFGDATLTTNSRQPPGPLVNDDFGGFSQASTATMGAAPSDTTDNFGGFEAAPIAASSMVAESPPLQDEFGAFGQPTQSTSTPTMSDAFGGLEGVVDAPLPSLDQIVASASQEDDNLVPDPQQTTPRDQVVADDFGGFNEAASSFANPMEASDPFAAVQGALNDPLPALGETLPATVSNDEDDFGGFEEAGPSAAVSSDFADPFSGMPGGSNDAPLPSLGTTGQMPMDFNGATQLASNDVPSSGDADVADSHPFAAMEGATVAPLTSPGGGTMRAVVDSSLPAAHEDDFGGFDETVPPVPAAIMNSQPLSSFDGTMASSQGGSSIQGGGISQTMSGESSVMSNPIGAASLADAFGDLGVQDAPLPPLDAFTAPTEASTTMGNEETGDEDDFGGFAGALPISTTPDIPAALSFTGSSIPNREVSALTSASGLTAVSTGSAVDNFDNVNNTMGHTLPTTATADDDFGDFGSATAGQSPALGTFDARTAAVSQPGATGSDGPGDKFGVFDSIPIGEHTSAAPESSANAEDDFGDFGSAQPQTNDDLFGAFDSAAQTEAVPAKGADDFGTFESISSTSRLVEDDFGDFSTAQSQVVESGFEQRNAHTSVDLFEGFDSTPRSTAFDAFESVPPESPPTHSIDQASKSATGDNVDAFASAATGAVGAPGQGNSFGNSEREDQPPAENLSDDFGAFDSAPAASQPQLEQPHDGASEVKDASDGFNAFQDAPAYSADNFGAFESSTDDTVAKNEFPESDSKTVGTNKNFKALDEAPPTVTESVSKEDFDDFGDFDSAPLNRNEPSTSTKKTDDGINDDFAAFEAGPSKTNATNQGFDTCDAGSNQDDKDFGEFSSTQAPTGQDDDDDWGAFDSAATSGPSDPSAKASSNTEEPFVVSDDEWGDFDESVTIKKRESKVRDQICGLAMPLHETILAKRGSSGDHVDLGDCFEVSIGTESTNDPEKKTRVDRCIQVLEVLTHVDHANGTTYWNQVLNVMKGEIEDGGAVIAEARRLSPGEQHDLRQPLQKMMAGFKEYVRVIRFIVAAIGDMLMLDPSAILSIDTLSTTWCDLSIMEMALETENLWKKMLNDAAKLHLGNLQSLDAPSLVEIRQLSCKTALGAKLCNLTLQPLSEKTGVDTTSTISWKGKQFMACSANLLANRCPFFA